MKALIALYTDDAVVLKECTLVGYDRDKYVQVEIDGVTESYKSGHIYTLWSDELKHITKRKLYSLPYSVLGELGTKPTQHCIEAELKADRKLKRTYKVRTENTVHTANTLTAAIKLFNSHPVCQLDVKIGWNTKGIAEKDSTGIVQYYVNHKGRSYSAKAIKALK